LKFPHRNQDITIHRAENVGTAVKANILAAGLILVGCALATEVSAQVTSSRDGRSVIYKGPANAAEPDYANAQPLLLPKPAFKPAVGPLNHHARCTRNRA
jgi:hypothetical protein